jgi:hypothetical protein
MAVSRQKIPSVEQRWLSESFVDPNGRLFEWRGEIYRVLEAEYAAQWRELTFDGTLQNLIADGLLIESELTQFRTESDKAVLRHRRIPVVSYCYEWTPAMLKEAALLTLVICIRLAERGLTLQDGHPWNILFEGTRPIYVDAGSIVPVRDDILWAPYQQFCNFFLFPLYLYASGRDHAARWLSRDYLTGVSDSDLLGNLPVWFRLRHPWRTLGVTLPRFAGNLFQRLPEELQQRVLSVPASMPGGGGKAKLRMRFFESLRKNIDNLRLPTGTSPWADYYRSKNRDYFHTDLSPGDWQKKQDAVARILGDLGPNSVLDVGANTGHYSRLAARQGRRVTACELDIAALNRCHEQARGENLNILPLAINVFSDSPTPGRGGVPCPPPSQRLRSELVMGLALMHHVVAQQRLPVGRIVEIIAAMSERWLLLEYVPPLKARIGASPVPNLDDYTPDQLERCLRKEFISVRPLPSYPEERRLFICAK